MSAREWIYRTMIQAQPLLPYMLVVTVVTALVLPVVLLMSRGIWADKGRFRWLGMFLGMTGGESMRLGCAWIKFLLFLAFLLGFRKLDVRHYLLFLVPGVLYALSGRDLLRIPGRILWLALQTAALLSCNLICGYILDMSAGFIYILIYILMAMFSVLFGVYLFLTELNDISAGRCANLEQDWSEEETE